MADVVSILACPKCGGDTRIPIVYGYPDEEMAEEAQLGLIILGGSVIDEDSPRWCCPLCEHAWGHGRPGPCPPPAAVSVRSAQFR